MQELTFLPKDFLVVFKTFFTVLESFNSSFMFAESISKINRSYKLRSNRLQSVQLIISFPILKCDNGTETEGGGGGRGEK